MRPSRDRSALFLSHSGVNGVQVQNYLSRLSVSSPFLLSGKSQRRFPKSSRRFVSCSTPSNHQSQSRIPARLRLGSHDSHIGLENVRLLSLIRVLSVHLTLHNSLFVSTAMYCQDVFPCCLASVSVAFYGDECVCYLRDGN